MTLRDQLLELQEPKYMKFTAALMPGVENVLGIRLPVLRKIARQIAAGDWRTYLAEAEDFYFEERMLQGLVIGCARCTPAEKLEHVARFVPKINNWAVCDCFCWRLKAAERQPMWEFIQPYFRSEAEYDVRFAVVTGLGISSTGSTSRHCCNCSTASATKPTTPVWPWHGRCRSAT